MLTFREFVHAFRELGLNQNQPVIVHASSSSFGDIRGGADTVLGALLSHVNAILAPAFTTKTMVYPETGPADNACVYGYSQDQNSQAEFFFPDLPADPPLREMTEAIRKHPGAIRSLHPILSFYGIGVEKALAAQTLAEPLAPIEELTKQNGVVVLIDVDHKVNISLHYAERAAGIKQFTRWALTPQGVRECTGFPGCTVGFELAGQYLQEITRTASIGGHAIQAVALPEMIQIISDLLREKPDALLCDKGDDRCEAVRRSIRQTENDGGLEGIE